MFDRLLAAIARALDAESIPYMVIGGQAVLLHGEPRLTKDIDVAVSRAKLVLLDGTNVRFTSAEDLIVHKILTGRPRDLEDIRSIMLKNPGLDLEFVRRTLAEFDKALARGDELSSRFDAVVRETRSD